MTVADDQLSRLLSAVLELDTPRRGEDAAAMVRRVAAELAELRAAHLRYYGVAAMARREAGR